MFHLDDTRVVRSRKESAPSPREDLNNPVKTITTAGDKEKASIIENNG